MKGRLFLFLIVLFFHSIFGTSSNAQQYTIQTYSLEEGIPQSQVSTIFEDSRGYIWFGTAAGGACRFDGINFDYFSTKEGLLDNSVKKIIEDSKGNILIATEKGVALYDGLELKNLEIRPDLKSFYIQTIFEDISENIWIGTEDKGVVFYDGKNFSSLNTDLGILSNNVKSIQQDKYNNVLLACYGGGISIMKNGAEKSFTLEDGLLDNEVMSILINKNGDVWYCSRGGITIVNDSAIKYLRKGRELSDYTITSIFQAEDETIWIGTDLGGVYHYDGTVFKNITTQNGLSSDYIYDIFCDRNNNVWIGTEGGGVCKYSGNAFTTYTVADGLSYGIVMAIEEDNSGNLWVGTKGKGINRYDGKKFRTFQLSDGISASHIYSIKKDNLGHIWMGSRDNGVYMYNGAHFIHYSEEQGLASKNAEVLFVDKKNIVWVGGDKGLSFFDGSGFRVIDERKGVRGKIVSISDDGNGNIWGATENNGLVMIPKRNEKEYDPEDVRHFTLADGLVSDQTTTLTKDGKGNVWIGCKGGVSMYDGKNFKNFTTTTGLTSERIYSLLFDENNILYVGSEKGIDVFTFFDDFQIDTKESYTSSNGFRGVECNPNAIFQDKEKNIWFGTVRGLIKLDPQKIRQENMLFAQPILKEITLFFEKIDWRKNNFTIVPWTRLPENLVLKHDQNHMTFEFSGLDFSNPEKTQYKFFLEGFDPTWSPGTNKAEVTYSNIPPGTYTFYLMTGNEQGFWNPQPYTYSFKIKPAIWQTWWFYVLSGIGVCTIVYLVVIWRTRRLSQYKLLLEQRVNERTKEIQKQKRELEKLSIVASKTNNGVVISDGDGLINWFNDAYAKITGYSLEEMKGKRPGDILVKGLRGLEKLSVIRDNIKNLEYSREEVEIETKEGKTVWIEINNTPVVTKSGNLKSQIEIITDITGRKKAEEELKRKNKEITESILYAKQIQEAVLPQRHILSTIKPDSFILYMPRDIVSGDFYWFDCVRDVLIFAAADSTGHGVPGAFMSMLGNEFLHQLVSQPNVTSTDIVLQKLDEKLREALHIEGGEDVSKAGIDIALCALSLKDNTLMYSGAYRPAIIMQGNEMIELSPQKFSVGGRYKDEKIFEVQSLKVNKGDEIYLFTDGYSDQFGGENNKKFLMKRLKEMILEIHHLPMNEQRKIFWQTMESWKGSNRQVDDILVMGIRV